MSASTPLWRRARCNLCTTPLLVRDDNEQVVCAACGARLQVLPAVGETRVRHIGEALDSVRESLDASAVQRALDRLRERQAAQVEALGAELGAARVRRAIVVVGTMLAVVSGLLAILGQQRGLSTLLFLFGLLVILASFGGRFALSDSVQRQREREATRARQALASEITRRERFLLEASRASRPQARS